MGVIYLGSSDSGPSGPGIHAVVSECTGGLGVAGATGSVGETPEFLQYTATLTNGEIFSQTVREVSCDGDDDTFFRIILEENDIPNFGVVPPGASVTVVYSLTKYPPDFADCSVYISMDTGGTVNAAPIHYNGHPITNGQIVAQTDNSWDIKGYTEIYAEISALNAFVGPVTIGQSITGKKYVVSALRSGSLFIKDLITKAKTSYSNCYVTDMKIEPFYLSSGRLGWYFTVSVVKSAYAEIL